MRILATLTLMLLLLSTNSHAYRTSCAISPDRLSEHSSKVTFKYLKDIEEEGLEQVWAILIYAPGNIENVRFFQMDLLINAGKDAIIPLLVDHEPSGKVSTAIWANESNIERMSLQISYGDSSCTMPIVIHMEIDRNHRGNDVND